jgi:hypothetical protein
MIRRVVLVRTYVLEELHASIVRVIEIDELSFLRRVRRLVITANFVPNSPILVALTMEPLSSSEMSVPTRATRRNNPEDTILHSHHRENLKSYKVSVL